jgi:hypothetical protein
MEQKMAMGQYPADPLREHQWKEHCRMPDLAPLAMPEPIVNSRIDRAAYP